MHAPRSRSIVAALVLLAAACTSGPDARPDPTRVADERTPAPTDPAATLGNGDRLPQTCVGGPAKARQDVAFVASGKAWAVDRRGTRVSCLFEVDDAGPFAWGPQGDRVLLADLEVRGVTGRDPSLGATGQRVRAFDWGHPLGLAVVFATSDPTPEKRFMDDGRVEPLDELPTGRYLDIAYHPSGLALAFVVDRGGRQRIWLSTNEGLDPVPLVYSRGGTRFTSIAFTPDGQHLVWTAQHAGGYPQIHAMDLADRTGFTDGWRGEAGQNAGNIVLPPEGALQAFDTGTTCDDRTATIALSPRVARPALPGSDRPTTSLGWLDATTLLVGVGGCDDTMDVVAVDAAGGATPVVLGVDAAAARTVTTAAPTSVPAPPIEAPEQPPPEGVG
jgi:WD40-like Beta Propeller Repeat